MAKAKYDWPTIREDYLASAAMAAFDGERYTLKEHAEKHSVTYQVLRNRASKEKWEGQLLTRSQALERAANERERLIVEKLRTVIEISELDVRRRHLQLAKLMQMKAQARLMAIETDSAELARKSLSVRDAIRLMQLGMLEEKNAAGIGIAFDKPHGLTLEGGQEATEFATPEDAMAAFRRIQDALEAEYEEIDDGTPPALGGPQSEEVG